MPFDQISPNPRNSQQRAGFRLITFLRPTVPEITKEFWPRIFPRAKKNSVRVLGSFVGQRGDVQAAQNDKCARLPIVICNPV